jgi:mannose-6-phosphate isomerase-like protein (cupin superfamily)
MTRREVLAAAIGTTLVPSTSAAAVQNSQSRVSNIHVPARTDRFGERKLLFGVAPHDCKLSAKDTAGGLFIAEIAGSAKPHDSAQVWIGPPLHVHFDQDERFFVLEGQVHFQIGGHASLPGRATASLVRETCRILVEAARGAIARSLSASGDDGGVLPDTRLAPDPERPADTRRAGAPLRKAGTAIREASHEGHGSATRHQ